MEYEVGRAGRIIVMRLHDGDAIYASIEGAAQKERVTSAAVWLVGGIKNAGVVVGPKVEDVFPLQVMEERFSDGREIVGFGTIFTNSKGEPRLHMHAAIGKGTVVIAGCPRKGADCWLVDEVVILEIDGLSARRVAEPKCGLELLTINAGQKKP
jgi:predicted DNA-binding protein with PD1-like motif